MNALTCTRCHLRLGLPLHPALGADCYNRKTLTAIHEAAHAVAVYHLGLEVTGLRIKLEGNFLDRPQYSGVCNFAPTKSRTDRRIMGVAGLVGEALFLGWNEWSEIGIGDFNQSDGKGLDPWNMPHAISRAKQILTDNWHLVRTLAEALEHAGELAGYMVKGLIQIELAGQSLREQSNGKGSTL